MEDAHYKNDILTIQILQNQVHMKTMILYQCIQWSNLEPIM